MADDKNRLSPLLALLFHSELTARTVLAISLLVTAFAWFIADDYANNRADDRFHYEVEDARQRITQRMVNYEEVLRSGVAMFNTLGRQPTRDEWHRFVATQRIDTYFPGIQGIGFATMVAPADKTSHEDALRAEGFPEYRIRPDGVREQYSAIVYLEPFDWRNRRAFGYDMFSEPVRRAAMEQARDSGQPAVSGRVTLVQETEKDVQAGFLVYLPIYRPGLPTATEEQRRAALAGYVYSPFRVKNLMQGILGTDNPDLDFELYDGTDAVNADTLLYSSQAADQPVGRHVAALHIALPGRAWTARFYSRPSFEAAMNTNQPEFIAIGGILVDILLYIIIRSLAGERRRVQAKAEEMTCELRERTERLDLAQESAGIGIWDYDLVNDRMFWDERMLALYGLGAKGFDGTYAAWQRCVHPEDLPHIEGAFRRLLNGQGQLNHQFRILCPDGRERSAEAHAIVQRADDGTPLRVIGTNVDVTERALAERRLRLAASVFDHAHEGIAITDADERIIDVNPTFTEVTGYDREEVLGKTPRLLSSGQQDGEFYNAMWNTLQRDGYWRGEIVNRRKNGETFTELLTVSRVRDDSGKVTNYVGVFSDISILKTHQHQLEHMAHYDALTQLPNRVLFADRMQQAMASATRNGKLLAVCYLDLDGFKPINDQFGHQAGDQLLMVVAGRLRAYLRGSDSVARLGGDEFVILLNDMDDFAQCEQALQRLLHAMAEPFSIDAAHTLCLSASIGVTLFPLDGSDADSLLRHADQAMYNAKQAGRNRYALFDPEQDRQTRQQHKELARIEQGLAANEFCLYYQPKVDMRSGRAMGAEALIRWRHPERGLLPPLEFLPLIEGTDLDERLGDWVLQQALTQLEAWRMLGLELVVSVNVSGHHLQQPHFAHRLQELLAQHPALPPANLELEILETTALADVSRTSRIIDQCRRLGVSFSLDDFGTGYSSLTYLKRLPVDILKIDQSFVRDMLVDPEDLAIIEGIIGLTHAFRRQVIAEGVETEEHGAMLLQFGCNLGQGYGIARPMPAADLPAWVASYRPPSLWSTSGNVYWLREDLPLLSAEIDHRRWVDDLIAQLEYPAVGRAHVEPAADQHECRFGQWLEGHGQTRYSHYGEFDLLKRLHDEVHALGRELLELARNGHSEQALVRRQELYELRDQVLGRIRTLRNKVPLEQEVSNSASAS